MTFIFNNERLAAINIAKLDHTSLFKQNVFPEQVVGEPHCQFPAFFPLASNDAVTVSVLLSVSIQLSWPLNLFVVTQGPEQGVLLYINVFTQYNRLFGTNIPFPYDNKAAWGNYLKSEKELQQPLNEILSSEIR